MNYLNKIIDLVKKAKEKHGMSKLIADPLINSLNELKEGDNFND